MAFTALNTALARLFFCGFKELQEGGRHRQKGFGDVLHFRDLGDLHHFAVLNPLAVKDDHQLHHFLDMVAPHLRQLRILAAKGVHLAVEEAIAPVQLEVVADEGQRRVFLRTARAPNIVGFFRHSLKQLDQNLFFIVIVKIEVARADIHGLGDVVRGDRDNTAAIEEFNGGNENAFFGLHVY